MKKMLIILSVLFLLGTMTASGCGPESTTGRPKNMSPTGINATSPKASTLTLDESAAILDGKPGPGARPNIDVNNPAALESDRNIVNSSWRSTGD